MLTVIVITKNEESRIKACLESVKFADEIIVCDNGSEDNTIRIAEKYTDKIFQTRLQDFAEIRNFATEKASGEWMLFVDADERVTEALRSEIETMISFSDFSAYALSRKNIVFGQEVKYGPFWPDWVIRVLKRTDFQMWVGKVHEMPHFSRKLGYSKNSLLHLTHRGVDQFMKKVLDWSAIEARLRLDANHPKMTKWRFVRVFLTELLNQGFKRRGFFGGTVGIIDSFLQTFHLYITYVRLWEMQQPKSLTQTYDDLDQQLIDDNFKY